MLFYLILIIAFGILCLAAFVTFVYALIKKQKNLMMTAAILLAVGGVGCLFSALVYSKKVYQYVTSNEFQKDTKGSAVFAGKTAGSVSSGFSDGFSTTLDDDAITKLAGKSATIMGKSIEAMAAGLDSTIGRKHVFIHHNLANSGIEPGAARERYTRNHNSMNIFISYHKGFDGKLTLTNYDKEGRKIDISEKEVHVKRGEERMEVFRFDNSDRELTTYYILSKSDQ